MRSYSWHTPGHGGGVAFRKSPVGQPVLSVLRREHAAVRRLGFGRPLGSLLDHTGPIAEGERNAARIFGADETLFVVGGTSTANKIVWHGMVREGRPRAVRPQLPQIDPALADHDRRDADLSRPVAQWPRDHRTDLHAISSRRNRSAQKVAASPFAKETSGKVRLMVMTNSTYDGLCYNVDAIKQPVAKAVEVLHFDEAWYAYANFHEFYDGYHAISSAHPARSPHAITFATHSTHKLLAALSQASMIHVQHSETQQLDMARFNEAFMMHTSTSPQYGIIASCDVAAAMMEQPAGRALVQETIDEALSFRRAMACGQEANSKGSWWFDVWQPESMASKPSSNDDRLGAEAGRQVARI